MSLLYILNLEKYLSIVHEVSVDNSVCLESNSEVIVGSFCRMSCKVAKKVKLNETKIKSVASLKFLPVSVME